jgi:uncharacterized protein with von Willebrand factor type A (vWA) domain
VLDIADRSTVRAALRAVLIKREADLRAFDHAFDLVFSAGWALDGHLPDESEDWTSSLSDLGASDAVSGDSASLASAVTAAAASGDVDAMSGLAARAVAVFGGDDGASARQVMYRALRALDMANMLSAVLRRVRADGGLSDLELSLRRHEVARALEAFRRALADEIDKLRDRQAVAGGSLEDLPIPAADRPVLSLTATDLRELRHTVQPLARQLAARVGRRRRARPSGRVDLRRTVRRSLQSGGIPIDPVLRRRHPHRPDVVVLCDISGSVAEFAQFTFTLVHAIHDVLAGVRSFAFVGGVADTTDVFADAVFDVPVHRLLERPGIVGLDGHSDYGAVFRQFAAEHIHLVGRRTTVIVTGDGRSNFRDPGVDAFRAITERARRVYWLDPERRDEWPVDDSAIPDYAPLCDGVFEVSTVRSLADVIAELV